MKTTLVCLIALFSLASAASSAPLTAACVPGGTYNPTCDVDHDGDVDIFDIQLTAGHWGQAGTYNIDPYSAMVPKTGQTTSYAAGDDGALQKGVAWPNPRFTDNGNGTVTDNLTGLIWLKNANCANALRNWATTLTDVAQLNTNGTMNGNTCGDTSNSGSHQTDWRLPNVREMQSLVHYGFSGPAVPNTAGTGKWTDGDPFTGVPPSAYWTSTTSAAYPVLAWYVYLNDGNVTYDGKSSTAFVWPVRGGQ